MIEQSICNAQVAIQAKGSHHYFVGICVGGDSISVGSPEQVKCSAEEVTVSNKDFEDAVEVFLTGLNIEFKNCIECFESFLRLVCITIYLDDVGKERRGNGIIKRLEA